MQLITGVVNGCGDIKFFFCRKYLSFSMVFYKNGRWHTIKKPPFLQRTEVTVLPPQFIFFSQKRPQQVQKYPHAVTGATRRSLCKKQSVRSSKAMFSVIPAPLFSLRGLSVAFCAAYSPFHCCCPLHFTIFWAFLSTDIQAKGEINGFCGKKLCYWIVAFFHEGGEGVIPWAKGGRKSWKNHWMYCRIYTRKQT